MKEQGSERPQGVDKIVERYRKRRADSTREHGRDYHTARGEVKAAARTRAERDAANGRLNEIRNRRTNPS